MVTRTPPTENVLSASSIHAGIVFLLAWGGVFVLFWGTFSWIEPTLQSGVAGHAQWVLEHVGVSTAPTQNPVQFWAELFLIEISPLCSGMLELILLSAAITATPGRSVRNKLLGITGGIFFLYVFNVLRIVFTILQLTHTSLAFATLTHDILFRITLLGGFALAYGIWLHSRVIWNSLTKGGWV